MRISHGALFALLLLSVPVVAQVPAATPKRQASSEAKKPTRPTAAHWLQAAEKFTADVTDEAWRLTALDHALLDVRLCSLWWAANQERARIWCASAADAVSHKPQQESDDERNARLIAAREIIRVVSPLDSALGQQVQDAIELATRDAKPDAGRNREYLAMSLGAAASEAADPEQAARLISESLRAGGAFQTIVAVFNLGQRAPARGDRSFAELLDFLRQTRNFNLADNLLREVFAPARNISAAWQQATVETITQMASVVPEAEIDRQFRCRLLGTVITAGDNVPQASAAAIRSVLADCESAAVNADANRRPGEPDLSQVKTVDDLLRAAAETRDLQSRVMLKYNAAMRAESLDHDCDRALDILDDLNEEELRARPGTIPNIRVAIATRGAVYALEHDQDIRAALHIVGRNPDNMRGSIELAAGVQATQKGLRGAGDLVQAALRDVRRYRSDDPKDYVTMANLSLRGGTLDIMRDMVRRVVEWEPLDRKALEPMERYFPPLEQSLVPLPLAPEIADFDPDTVLAVGRSVRRTKLRASFDLGVLQHLTRRFVEEQQRAKPPRKRATAAQ